MTGVINNFLDTAIFFLPLWLSNLSMGIASYLKFLDQPLDGGHIFFDGRRIIGENKKINGIIIATITGLITGIMFNNWFYGLLFGTAAWVGDMLNSFTKRRLNIKPGNKLPFFDQTNYAITGLLIIYPFKELIFQQIVIVIIISLIFHRPACWLGLKLKMRKYPW